MSPQIQNESAKIKNVLKRTKNFIFQKTTAFVLCFGLLFGAFGPGLDFFFSGGENWTQIVEAADLTDEEKEAALKEISDEMGGYLEDYRNQWAATDDPAEKEKLQGIITELTNKLDKDIIGNYQTKIDEATTVEELNKIKENFKKDLGDNSKKSGISIATPSPGVMNFGEIASFFLSIFTPLLAVETAIIGGMMDNEFILGKGGSESGDKTDIGYYIHMMWQIMRDLVNYAFILVLIVIAFMTVVSAGNVGGDSNFEVKTALPKLVIGIVLVNFTWFGARVILDTATIATHVVYAIPSSIPGLPEIIVDNKGKCDLPWNIPPNSPRPICPTMVKGVSIKGLEEKTLDDVAKSKEMDWANKSGELNSKDSLDSHLHPILAEMKDLHTDEYVEGSSTVKKLKEGIHVMDMDWAVVVFTDFDWKAFDENSISSLFAFSIMHVEQLPMARGSENGIRDLVVKSIVGFVIMIMLLVVFSAMMLALIERVIIIWINIILSPVGVLLWVLKGSLNMDVQVGNESIGMDHFIKMAFLPAAMGLPLVLGFTMIIVAKSANLKPFEGSTLLSNIKGLDMLIPNVTDVHQLMWFLLAILVMWTSMGIAESIAKYTGEAIGDLKKKAEAVTNFVVKSPMYMTWIPVHTPGGDVKQMSAAGMGGVIDRLPTIQQSKVNTEIEENFGDMLKGRPMLRVTNRPFLDGQYKKNENSYKGLFQTNKINDLKAQMKKDNIPITEENIDYLGHKEGTLSSDAKSTTYLASVRSAIREETSGGTASSGPKLGENGYIDTSNHTLTVKHGNINTNIKLADDHKEIAAEGFRELKEELSQEGITAPDVEEALKGLKIRGYDISNIGNLIKIGGEDYNIATDGNLTKA